MPALSVSDKLFRTAFALLGGSYVLLLILLVVADMAFASLDEFAAQIIKPEFLFSIRLTLITCTAAGLLSLLIGVPLGYLLSRWRFPLRWLVDGLVEIPVVLPPLVVGISLLILFSIKLNGVSLDDLLQQHLGQRLTYTMPAVIIAQFTVAAAFAARTMRVTFDQISPRAEQVAQTLGCNQWQAFWRVALPQSRRGMLAAFTIAWARSLGEFGPILVFAGATRMRTEVLSTTVFLEFSTGSLVGAVTVSLLMVAVALVVLLILRALGTR